MFDKFGEVDSFEELNRMAKAQRDEQDEEALMILAEENGIDKEDAEDFYDGVFDELTNAKLAAIGKLKVECREYDIKGILKDWVDEIVADLNEDESLALAIRKKGRDLGQLIADMAEFGYKNRTDVSTKIVDKTKDIKKVVGNHSFSIGFPDRVQRKKLVKEYYCKEGEKHVVF